MKRIITSIVQCPACDSKNVYGEMNEDAISHMLIHCYDCGIIATRGQTEPEREHIFRLSKESVDMASRPRKMNMMLVNQNVISVIR